MAPAPAHVLRTLLVLLVLPLPAAGPAMAAEPRLYAPSSQWNKRLAVTAPVDTASPVMVKGLLAARRDKGFPIAVREWTVPVYQADARTPLRTVALRRPPPSWSGAFGTVKNLVAAPPGWLTDPARWGPQLGTWSAASHNEMRNVPIPANAAPDPQLDAHMTVIDQAAGCEYDLYGAHRASNGSWQAVWANATRTDGTGIYPAGLSSKASGFAGAAGLIRPEELRAGKIDHALFLGLPETRTGGHVAPATSSDGVTNSSRAVPLGARIRLDPGLDVDKLGLAPYERTVARAMQEYGMFVGDTGGAMSLYAVHPRSFATDPYAGVLPKDDYAYLEKIPVSRLQVMELPPQRTGVRLNVRDSGCGVPD